MPANPRVRANFGYGLTTDNPLTAGAATFNSAGLVTLPAIVAQHAVVVLDPGREFGEPEIVVVTAHTAAATVATITRGQYGTVARSHPQGTTWVHTAIDEDFIEILTSSTRPSNPYEGQFIFETDTNKLVGYGGVDWAPRDAGGQLGFAIVTTAQVTITAEVNLTGLSVNVTVGTGRLIRISGVAPYDRTVADGLTRLRIKEGATGLFLTDDNVQTASTGNETLTASCILTPSAGPHTYNLTMQQVTGTGTSALRAGIASPAYILVEDIGTA